MITKTQLKAQFSRHKLQVEQMPTESGITKYKISLLSNQNKVVANLPFVGIDLKLLGIQATLRAILKELESLSIIALWILFILITLGLICAVLLTQLLGYGKHYLKPTMQKAFSILFHIVNLTRRKTIIILVFDAVLNGKNKKSLILLKNLSNPH